MSDPYSILGVERTATDADIKAAFRKLAKEHHPDKNGGSDEAKARFQEINTAYESIKTADKRASNNERNFNFGSGDFGFEFHGHDLNEIFRNFHHQNQQNPRNRNYSTICSVSLIDAFRGCEVSLKFEDRDEIRVKLPPGVDNGTRLRVAGAGENVHSNHHPGDLFVTVQVAPDENFRRDGKMLINTVVIDSFEAMLGGKISVPTIDGDSIEVEITSGIQFGHQVRITGRGMPIIGTNNRGDQIVQVLINTPQSLTEQQMEMLRDIKNLSN